jgi:phenylpropionate dioxygenase-like ring-hydroxylating dioxygenase large terminal subunit
MDLFKGPVPRLFGHKDSLKDNKFFASNKFVINQQFEAFTNICPHRGFPILQPAGVADNMRCELHGWQWNDDGTPTNNSACLKPRNLTVGKSGLMFMDWQEPSDAKWVNDLANDSFTYSHSTRRTGTGDWKWQMEMHVDLLHVDKIHPLLTSYVDIHKLQTEYGSDWVCQHHEHGWWLFIYPFTHIEWEPGCLYFSEMVQTDYGYEVYIHYLFNESTPQHVRENFIKVAEVTFDEDVDAVNRLSLNNKYRTPSKTLDPLEVDIKHFYDWYKANT